MPLALLPDSEGVYAQQRRRAREHNPQPVDEAAGWLKWEEDCRPANGDGKRQHVGREDDGAGGAGTVALWQRAHDQALRAGGDRCSHTQLVE